MPKGPKGRKRPADVIRLKRPHGMAQRALAYKRHISLLWQAVSGCRGTSRFSRDEYKAIALVFVSILLLTCSLSLGGVFAKENFLRQQ